MALGDRIRAAGFEPVMDKPSNTQRIIDAGFEPVQQNISTNPDAIRAAGFEPVSGRDIHMNIPTASDQPTVGTLTQPSSFDEIDMDQFRRELPARKLLYDIQSMAIGLGAAAEAAVTKDFPNAIGGVERAGKTVLDSFSLAAQLDEEQKKRLMAGENIFGGPFAKGINDRARAQIRAGVGRYGDLYNVLSNIGKSIKLTLERSLNEQIRDPKARAQMIAQHAVESSKLRRQLDAREMPERLYDIPTMPNISLVPDQPRYDAESGGLFRHAMQGGILSLPAGMRDALIGVFNYKEPTNLAEEIVEFGGSVATLIPQVGGWTRGTSALLQRAGMSGGVAKLASGALSWLGYRHSTDPTIVDSPYKLAYTLGEGASFVGVHKIPGTMLQAGALFAMGHVLSKLERGQDIFSPPDRESLLLSIGMATIHVTNDIIGYEQYKYMLTQAYPHYASTAEGAKTIKSVAREMGKNPLALEKYRPQISAFYDGLSYRVKLLAGITNTDNLILDMLSKMGYTETITKAGKHINRMVEQNRLAINIVKELQKRGYNPYDINNYVAIDGEGYFTLDRPLPKEAKEAIDKARGAGLSEDLIKMIERMYTTPREEVVREQRAERQPMETSEQVGPPGEQGGYFHGTNSAGLEGIVSEGFRSKGAGVAGNLTKNFRSAASYAAGKRLVEDGKAYVIETDANGKLQAVHEINRDRKVVNSFLPTEYPIRKSEGADIVLPPMEGPIKGDLTPEDTYGKDYNLLLRDKVNQSRPFYSQAVEVAKKLPDGKLNADEVMKRIQKSDVSFEEIDWMDIGNFLAGKKTVTREELLDYMNDNAVVIVERWQGEGEAFRTMGFEGRGYEEPGGRDYKEILFMMPGNEFTHMHFGDLEGVIAHARMNTRDLRGGGKDLHVEELQSDLHQKGAVEGYNKTSKEVKRLYALYDRISELDHLVQYNQNSIRDINEHIRILRGTEGKVVDERVAELDSDRRRMAQELDDAKNERLKLEGEFNRLGGERRLDELETISGLKLYAPPDTPLKESWHKVIFKRLLDYAINNGFDSISLATGEQQIGRYGTEYVEWSRNVGTSDVADSYEIGLYPHVSSDKPLDISRAYNEKYFHNFEVTAKERQEGTTPKELVELIKKSFGRDSVLEWSDKKVEQYADRLWSKMQKNDTGRTTPRASGMRHFYDKEMINWIKKYVKKWGMKVEVEEVSAGQNIRYSGPDITVDKIYNSSRGDKSLAALKVRRVADIMHRDNVGVEEALRILMDPTGKSLFENRLEIQAMEVILPETKGKFNIEQNYMKVPTIRITDAAKKEVVLRGQRLLDTLNTPGRSAPKERIINEIRKINSRVGDAISEANRIRNEIYSALKQFGHQDNVASEISKLYTNLLSAISGGNKDYLGRLSFGYEATSSRTLRGGHSVGVIVGGKEVGDKIIDPILMFDRHINITQNADLVTLAHEIGHDVTDMLLMTDPKFYSDMISVYKNDPRIKKIRAKSNKDVITRAIDELVAEDFASYIRSGKAVESNSILRGLFTRLTMYLSGIYRWLANENLEVHPTTKKYFDKVLSGELGKQFTLPDIARSASLRGMTIKNIIKHYNASGEVFRYERYTGPRVLDVGEPTDPRKRRVSATEIAAMRAAGEEGKLLVRAAPTAKEMAEAENARQKFIGGEEREPSVIRTMDKFNQTIKAGAEEVSKNKGVVKKFLREAQNMTFAHNYELQSMLSKLGPAGREVVMNMDKAPGAGPHIQHVLAKAYEDIYGGLSPKEYHYLDVLIPASRTKALWREKGASINYSETMSPNEAINFVTKFYAGSEELGLTAFETARIQLALERHQAFYKGMLKDLVEFGLISGEEAGKMSRTEFYNPLDIIDRMDDIDKTNGAYAEPGKLSVTRSGILPLDQGTRKKLETDSYKLMQQYAMRLYALGYKNKADLSLLDIARDIPDNGFVVEAETQGKAPEGYKKVYAFENGERKTMWMDENLAEQWKTSEQVITGALASVVKWIGGTPVIKYLATGINPEFALRNVPRDAGLIVLSSGEYSPIIPYAILQYGKDIAEVAGELRDAGWNVKHTKGFEDLVTHGGGQLVMAEEARFGLGREGRTKARYVVKEGRIVKENVGGAKDEISNFFYQLQNFAGWMGLTSEYMGRIALYKRAIKNGRSPEEAAYIALSYLNFRRGGYAAKAADLGIPYLNPAIQALESGAKGILGRDLISGKYSPAKGAVKLASMMATFMALRAAGNLISHKTLDDTLPEIQDSNIIIPAGGMYYVDDNGEKRYFYASIPLDQTMRGIMTIANVSTDIMMGRQVDTERVARGIKQTLAVFPRFTSSGFIDGFTGAVTGYDWFEQRRFIGEPEVRPYAEVDINDSPMARAYSKVAKKIYEKYNVGGWLTDTVAGWVLSPKRMSHFISSYVPGNNTFIWLAGAQLKETLEYLPEPEREKSMAEIASQVPFARQLFKATNPYTRPIEDIREMALERNTINAERMMEFRGLVESYRRTGDKEYESKILDFLAKQKPRDTMRFLDGFIRQLQGNEAPRSWLFQIMVSKLPNPEDRAVAFKAMLDSAGSPEQKKLLIQGAATYPGFATDRMIEEWGRLISENR